MRLLEEWGWQYPNEREARGLHAELQREVPSGHLLFGRAVEVIAFQENQDVLFRHLYEPDRFTVIHLTWVKQREINAKFPWVCFDGTFEQFFAAEEKFYGGRDEGDKK